MSTKKRVAKYDIGYPGDGILDQMLVEHVAKAWIDENTGKLSKEECRAVLKAWQQGSIRLNIPRQDWRTIYMCVYGVYPANAKEE